MKIVRRRSILYFFSCDRLFDRVRNRWGSFRDCEDDVELWNVHKVTLVDIQRWRCYLSNANCTSSCDEFQVCKRKSEEWMPDMHTTVDGRSQVLQGRERDVKWWLDEYDTIGFWPILVMTKRSCHWRAKAEGPFQFDCDPRSSRRRVDWYFWICDLFLNFLCVWQHLH